MLDIEQKYKDLYNSYGGKKLKLTFYKEEYRALYPSETLYPSDQLYPSEMEADAIDFVITDDMIQTDSMVITESLCSEEELNFGACESAEFEIVVSGLTKDIAGKEFVLSEQFGDYELMFGLFTVDSTPKQGDRDTRKIIAYDRMTRFDEDVSGWYKLLSFPMTLKDLRTSLCDFVGITQVSADLVNDSMIVEKTIDPKSLNGRDFLKYICQINGVFGNITKNGELQYIAIPATHNISSEIEVYQSVESEEYSVPNIDTVKIQQEEGDIGGVSTGDGINTYIIEGNPLVYGKTTSQMAEIANNIKSVIKDISYCPASISTNGSPWIEVGDRLEVGTSDGVINTIVMKRTMTGIQGAMDEFSSSGSQELKRKFNIRSEIIQLQGKTAVITKNVEEVSVKLTDLKDYAEAQFKITAEQISSEVTRALNAEEQLSSRITQTANQIELKVSKGQVSAQLSVEPDKVTISGNRLIVNSTNFKLDGNGNATFSGDITGARVTATNISASSISGGSISGTTITGGTMTGTTIIGGGGMFEVDSDGVYIGGFEARADWGRDIFQSADGLCGMSSDPGKHGGLWFWAGWLGAGRYDFLVNNLGEMHCNEVYINKSWWEGWSLTKTMQEIYDYAVENRERIQALERA